MRCSFARAVDPLRGNEGTRIAQFLLRGEWEDSLQPRRMEPCLWNTVTWLLALWLRALCVLSLCCGTSEPEMLTWFTHTCLDHMYSRCATDLNCAMGCSCSDLRLLLTQTGQPTTIVVSLSWYGLAPWPPTRDGHKFCGS